MNEYSFILICQGGLMGLFTFVPVWIAQDSIVFIAATITVIYIFKNEQHVLPVLLEFASFVFLYAAVYENFATFAGWYGYGRSLLMIGNVPLSVPVFEFVTVYIALQLAKRAKLPTWSRPFVAGLFGMLADFSLDPVAIKQVFTTLDRTIGRWSWFPGPGDVLIYGEPVYNFSGWMLLCGYAAAALLLGRWWFEKSGYRSVVALLYPSLSMIAALLVMISPLSRFLLWLWPIFDKGSFAEWIMLAAHLAGSTTILIVLFRRRAARGVSLREDWPLLAIPAGFHIVDFAFALIGGYYSVIWLVILAACVHIGLSVGFFLAPRRDSQAFGKRSMRATPAPVPDAG